MDQIDRQSLSDRFDKQRCLDYLLEDILQFLPNDDKLKLRGVSQQFERTILQELSYIDVDNLQVLQLLLQNCSNRSVRNVRSITYLNAGEHTLKERLQIIGLIKQICNHLPEFKSFRIEKYDFDSIDDPNPKDLDLLLYQISTLNHLEELKIFEELGLNNDRHKEWFEELAHNLPKLKSFGCVICVDEGMHTEPNLWQFFAPLKQLKELDLRIDNTDFINSFNETFRFQQFNGLHNITHLTLDFMPTEHILDEKVLKDIDTFLPNLQYLRIRNQMSVSNWALTILSRLPDLKTMDLDLIYKD